MLSDVTTSMVRFDYPGMAGCAALVNSLAVS
jgi:hypothetical protein